MADITPINAKRRKGQTKGVPVATYMADAERRRHVAVDMFVRCHTLDDIAAHLGIGVGGVRKMLDDEFDRRAKDHPGNVERARQMFIARYEAMLAVWLPSALGEPNVDRIAAIPADKAVETTLRIMDRLGRVQGVDSAPHIAITQNTLIVNSEQAREQVLRSLDAAAERLRTIEAGEAPQ